MREALIRETASMLAGEGYEVFCCAGMRACFDIVARREGELLIAKALEDVDALTSAQAGDLRKISLLLGADFLLLGERFGDERLRDGVLYERQGVPAISFGTLRALIVDGTLPSERKFKVQSISVDGEKLAKARRDANLTLDELAGKAGVSRETLWRYEKGKIGASEESISQLEKILGMELRKSIGIFGKKPEHVDERTILSPVGFESVRASSAPFELAAKEKGRIIAGEEADRRTMAKRAGAYGKISGIFRSSSCFILEESARDSIGGVPVVRKREVKEMKKPRDLLKLVEEREE